MNLKNRIDKIEEKLRNRKGKVIIIYDPGNKDKISQKIKTGEIKTNSKDIIIIDDI